MRLLIVPLIEWQTISLIENSNLSMLLNFSNPLLINTEQEETIIKEKIIWKYPLEYEIEVEVVKVEVETKAMKISIKKIKNINSMAEAIRKIPKIINSNNPRDLPRKNLQILKINLKFNNIKDLIRDPILIKIIIRSTKITITLINT